MPTRRNSDLATLNNFNPGSQYALMHGPHTNWGLFNGHFDQGPSSETETDPPEGWFTMLLDAGSEVRRVPGGLTGYWCMRGGSPNANTRGGELLSQKYTPVDESSDYVLAAAFTKSIANCTVSFGVSCYDANKAFLGNSNVLTAAVPAAIWPAWDAITPYTIGPGGTAFKAGTKYIRVRVVLQQNAALGANAYSYVDAIRLCDPCLDQGGGGGAVGACALRWYDVKCYGAIGDGGLHPLSDFFPDLASAQAVYPFVTALTQEIDYAGWQAAINAAIAAGGGAVYGPTGDYVIDTQLEANLTDEDTALTIEGDGYNSHLFVRSDSSLLNLLRIKSATPASYQIVGWSVKDLRFDGNRANGAHVQKLLRCIVSGAINRPCHGHIQRVWAHSADGNGAVAGGITLTNDDQTVQDKYWQDIEVADCHTWDMVAGWGIGLNANRGVTISGCTVADQSSNGSGIAVWMSQDVTINGCICKNCAAQGFELESVDRVTLSNCVTENAAGITVVAGIQAVNSVDVTVSGCISRVNLTAAGAAALRLLGKNAPATQKARACAHVLLKNSIFESIGTTGHAVLFDDDPDDGSLAPTDVRIRGCDILNDQTTDREHGIYGNVDGVEITDCHVEGAITLFGINGGDSHVMVEDCDVVGDFDDLHDLLRFRYMTHVVVNGNKFVCDTGAGHTVRAIVYFNSACSYFDFGHNHAVGRVDYILFANAVTVYPNAQGNEVNALTVDTALTAGTTYPPAAGIGIDGATIWCDFNGSGNPMCYTRIGGIWTAGSNW